MRSEGPLHMCFFSECGGKDILSIFDFFGSMFSNYPVYLSRQTKPDTVDTQRVIVCLYMVYIPKKGLYSKAHPAFLHTPLQDTLSCGGLLSSHKAVGFCAFSFLWLVCN